MVVFFLEFSFLPQLIPSYPGHFVLLAGLILIMEKTSYLFSGIIFLVISFIWATFSFNNAWVTAVSLLVFWSLMTFSMKKIILDKNSSLIKIIIRGGQIIIFEIIFETFYLMQNIFLEKNSGNVFSGLNWWDGFFFLVSIVLIFWWDNLWEKVELLWGEGEREIKIK